jgi:hypothetical protein
MQARTWNIGLGLLLAGSLALTPPSDAKPAKAGAAHARAHAKPGSSESTHNAAPPDNGLPESQRLAIQADIVWLGSYGEMSVEEINVHLLDQIKAFQRRNSGKDTGILTDQERAVLAEAAKAPQAAVGWRVIDDIATGARLGVPEKLVPKVSATRIGSHWSAAQGQVQIETFRLHEASLPALFDQDKKIAQRIIGSSALGPNSFFITGEQKLKKFVERVQSKGSEVRGVTILYDQATEGTMAPIALAVADTFEGFPDPAVPPSGRKRGIEYGSAIVVSAAGDLVTSAEVADDCRSVTVPDFGHAERIAADQNSGLALLKLYGTRNLAPMPLADDFARPGAALTLLGVADPLAPENNDTVTRLGTHFTEQGLDPLPQPGFSGAAAVDGQGRLAGVVEIKWPPITGATTAMPQATLVAAGTVRGFLQAHGITPVPAAAAATDQSVLRVICVRN